MKILVTGANGWVGRALCSALDEPAHQLVRAVRRSSSPMEVCVGDVSENTDWREALGQGTDVVVHLAAQVPLMGRDPIALGDLYTRVNVLGTANLARQCARHGVARFVFVSTAKVLGEGKDEPYRETDVAKPSDAYAASKWQAEQMLWQIAQQSGMEVVVLRPPLVYGPGVKGHFWRLMRAIDQQRPLPLRSIRNRRSLIGLDNLVDVIRLCLVHPRAAGQAFLVSDGEDVSTPELIRRLASALDCRPVLLPAPASWIKWAGGVLGKQAAVDRLVGSLCLDISPLRQALGWTPPITLQEGLDAAARWYRQMKSGV